MNDSNAPRDTIYVTTPIYYVNDRPHIGHVYSTTVCDAYARYNRFAGRDVFFLTGTDEHAAKVVEAAAQRGLSPKEWADKNAAEFRDTFDRLQLSYDDFIRTTERRHIDRVKQYVTALLKSGDVYLGDYVGWYDAGQEEYVPDSKAKGLDYKSPINGKPLVKKTEKNYFFKLSAYREKLLALLEKAGLVDGCTFAVLPDARRNEIVQRIKDAEDVPISRTGSTGWGIPVPGDEAHTIYVWIDALFNYLTTVDTDDRRKYWQCGPVHVIAKDILWFHAAIWPAILLALRKCPGYDWVNLPRFVYSHSFWISEGQKMSKTLGNFIDLEKIDEYVATYSLDALRYFLIKEGPLGATDSDFSQSQFHETYNTDLVNTIGNCASRVSAMIGKYFDGKLPEAREGFPTTGPVQKDWHRFAKDLFEVCDEKMAQFQLNVSVGYMIAKIREIDAYINMTEPFKLAKDASKRDDLAAILYQCAEALRIASLYLWPVCPDKIAELWQAMSLDIDPGRDTIKKLCEWGGLKPGTRIQKTALFPRVEPQTVGA